ncbi:hypothetical protein LL14B4_04710 [Lactococcus lactis subsp. lactis]|uniref:Uncharacterized protein n=1 Tax=Lactococcus lactis subsp. lactis TaxID=1360 RepID=A0A2Z3KFG6_LACLL|nr:hypothetical protein [Lactococcus lactis]AWN65511.1 hypothetical protein LL14B4_04710 [Lactococcus lactis subsp. lactis]
MAQDTFTSREFPNPKNITVIMPVDKWDKIKAAQELITDKFENVDMNGYDGERFYFDKDEIAKINEAFL